MAPRHTALGKTRIPHPGKILIILSSIALILHPVVFRVRAADKEPPESQVKAAFLLNFPKYVEWPPAMLSGSNSPIVIAFFGRSEIADAFRTIIRGRNINGHPLEFKQLEKEEECSQTEMHILFIAGSEYRRIPAVLERMKHANVLTVSETDDFMQAGGMINMIRRDRKIRLQINLASARRAQLKISSKLLSLAEVKEDTTSK